MTKKYIRLKRVEENPTIFERLKISPLDFSLEIERRVLRSKFTYLEAIIEFCEENEIELERVKGLINPTLKEKIKAEAIKLHTLKR